MPAKAKSTKDTGVMSTVQAAVGDKIWVSEKKDDDYSIMWSCHKVASLSSDKRTVHVADTVSKRIWEVKAEETLPYDVSHDQPLENIDLTRVNYLHEASLLATLRQRYMNDSIYTNFGDTVLSINPYHDVESLYDAKKLEAAQKEMEDQEIPHVFSVANRAFGNLKSQRRSQSIVINGDSGAGKTEAAKQIMRHLVSLSNSAPEIERLVLESTPVLEAFGNSVTLRNENSSRFGRFIQIMYEEATGVISGMHTEHFLLEKSRLIKRSPGERNYHIFYQCCSSLQHLGFEQAARYTYLQPLLTASNYTGVLPDDVSGFKRTVNALNNIGIGEKVQGEIWKILLAFLSIGNIEFVPKESDKSNTGACRMADTSQRYLEVAAQQLGISDARLLEEAMIKRTITAGRGDEKTVIELSVHDARESRDALARFLYSSLFDWVVHELNRQSSRHSATKKTNGRKKEKFIGILDIFGFEDLEHNSFEQICVNYANELLQKQFDFYVIESEKRLFREEGVEFPDIVLPSVKNSEMVIELLTVNLYNALEEQCLLRTGTDAGFLSNLQKIGSDKFSKDWKNDNGFIIKHFAGEVRYDSAGFVDKNRDALTHDLRNIVQSNASELLQEEIGGRDVVSGRTMAAKETVLKKFKTDMNNLISTISKTGEIFLRCIKPNHDQAAKEWDVKLVLSQLGYLGILQAIRVHQETYPVRRNFSFIAEKYHQLLDKDSEFFVEYRPGVNDLEVLRAVLYHTLGKDSEFKLWQCGHRMVFLGNEVLFKLDGIVNERRLAALAAMSEDERRQELEKERLRIEQELRAAREEFEKQKKEEEELRRKRDEERRRREDEERQRRLQADEEERARREKELNKKIKVREEEARKRLEEEESKLKKEISERKKALESEAEVERAIITENREKLRKEEEALKKKMEEERAMLERETVKVRSKIAREEKELSEKKQQTNKELEETIQAKMAALDIQEKELKERLEEEKRELQEEKEREKEALEQERKKIDLLVAEEKKRLENLSAQEKSLQEEERELRKKLGEEQERIKKEENLLREQKAEIEKLKEEQDKLKKSLAEERVKLEEEAKRLKKMEEERTTELEQERLRIEGERERILREERERVQEEERRIQERKRLREEKRKQAQEKKQKVNKLARRKAKLNVAKKMQAIVRGMIVRKNYRHFQPQRKLFENALSSGEMVIFSSVVVRADKKSGKRKFLVVTSNSRVLVLTSTLQIEDEATYDNDTCKAVAHGPSGEELYIYFRDEYVDPSGVTKEKAVTWKFRDMLNPANAWIHVLNTVNDYSVKDYILRGFFKPLGHTVKKADVVFIYKASPLTIVPEENPRGSKRLRLSLGKSEVKKTQLFLLIRQSEKVRIIWYDDDKQIEPSGRLPVTSKLTVDVPSSASFGGRFVVYAFQLTMFLKGTKKVFMISARTELERNDWVRSINYWLKRYKRDLILRRKSINRDAQIKTLRRVSDMGMARKSSFNADDFMAKFQTTDRMSRSMVKQLARKKSKG